MDNTKKHACIVVLGDFGRSPRMQYHTKSLLEENYIVDVFTYCESEPLDYIKNHENANLHNLRNFPEMNLPSFLKYILKTLWQSVILLMALLFIQKPDFILIQNPPAVPTLIMCFIYAKLRGTSYVIDWHNYTHTILSMNSNPNGPIVKLSSWIEGYFGRRSSANFCVTKAMQADLMENWGISARVLYDRPPKQFHPISIDEKHELFMKLSKQYKEFASENNSVLNATAFTQKMEDGTISYRTNRPAILISSTSWTPDEDFSILLAALEDYEKSALAFTNLPKLLCIITGKGPQKEYYNNIIAGKKWEKICIITPWLDLDDYPRLLASADLGVCLHWSSSGLDLPMKVVDMFGVGLVVCAKKFKCLNELVQHYKNGFVFNDSVQLAEQLETWFEDFPNNKNLNTIKKTFRTNLEKFQTLRWQENWSLVASPVFSKFVFKYTCVLFYN